MAVPEYFPGTCESEHCLHHWKHLRTVSNRLAARIRGECGLHNPKLCPPQGVHQHPALELNEDPRPSPAVEVNIIRFRITCNGDFHANLTDEFLEVVCVLTSHVDTVFGVLVGGTQPLQRCCRARATNDFYTEMNSL